MVTADQAAVVKKSWPGIASGDGGASVGLDMFVRYFTANPSMMSFFGYVGSPDSLRTNAKLMNHGKLIIQQIGAAVFDIDDPAKMTSILRALGQRHKGFGDIKASYFPALGDAMLTAMDHKVGGGLNKEAWAAAYKAISEALISGLQS